MIKIFLSLTLLFHCVTNINAMNLKQKYGRSFNLPNRLCRAMDNTNTSSDFSKKSFHCNEYKIQTYKVYSPNKKCYEIDSDPILCGEFHNKLESVQIGQVKDSFFSGLTVNNLCFKISCGGTVSHKVEICNQQQKNIHTIKNITSSSNKRLLLYAGFNNDCSKIVITNFEGYINIFEVGSEKASISIYHGAPVIYADFNEASTWLVATSNLKNDIKIHDVKTGDTFFKLPLDTTDGFRVFTAFFSSDETIIASFSNNDKEKQCIVREWDIGKIKKYIGIKKSIKKWLSGSCDKEDKWTEETKCTKKTSSLINRLLGSKVEDLDLEVKNKKVGGFGKTLFNFIIKMKLNEKEVEIFNKIPDVIRKMIMVTISNNASKKRKRLQ